jgi:uncharacterized protein
MAPASRRVQIVDLGPRLNKPNIIVGVPEAGLVGTIASSYLLEQLKLEERGYIDSDLIPPVMVVHDSMARYPVHIFGKNNVVVVMSEVPLVGRASLEVAREIASWAKSVKANILVGVTGAPSRSREEAQAEGKPAIVGVGNDEISLKLIKTSGVSPFNDGVISGFYASLLRSCTNDLQPALVLLAESLAQFPDPGAAVAIIGALNNLMGLKVDTKPLVEEAEGIRLKTRELMQQTQQAQQQAAGPTGGGTAYR